MKKIFTLLFFLSFFTIDLYAQCAGTSGAITICDKETLNGGANGVIDLNTIITGETSGGTWTETTSLPCGFSGGGSLNNVTGLLNTWQIRRGCVYQYTYTCSGDGSASTVTLTLGGYPGVGTDGDVCADTSEVNLFSFLGSNPNADALNISPNDGGGVFTSPAAGLITGNEFNATLVAPDDGFYPTYLICYTVPATATCPSRQTCFNITINQKAEAGTTSTLNLCETDYLTFPTNFDLQTLFNPTPVRDSGGDWSDETVVPFGPASPANGILNSGDSVINIRAIYDAYVATNGHDASHTDQDIELTFTYAVYPTHPICNPESKATFTIIIERGNDFNGGSVTAASVGVCLNEATTTPIVMTIHENPLYPVEDGTYDISYTLTGVNAASAGGGATVPVTFSGGTGDITLNLTNPVNVGTTTLCITNAVENDSAVNPKCSRTITGVCETFEVYATPNPTITDGVICVDQTTGNSFTSHIFDTGLDNATYDFVWYYNAIVIPGASSSTYEANQAGNYCVVITNSNTSCISSPICANVYESYPAEISVSAPTAIIKGESSNVVITSNMPANTISNWTVVQNGVTGASDGTGNTIDQVLTTIGTLDGTVEYTIISTDSNGCTNVTNQVTINVIYVPGLVNGTIGTDGVGNVTQPYILDTGLSDSRYSCEWTLDGVVFRGTNGVQNVITNQYSATQAGRYCVVAVNNTTGFRSSEACADVTTQVLSNNEFNTISLVYNPNPVTDVLTIQSKELLKKVTVYNTLGQMVYLNALNDLNPQIELSNLVTGNYFVKVETENKQNVFQIIKK